MVFNSNLIDFFKRHNLYNEEMFDYFSRNSSMIDYEDKEQRLFIGCFYTFGKDKRLKDIHLNVPYVYNDITMLVSIHEFIHAIILYKNINKKVNIGIDKEVLPMLYEKIYINENNNPILIEYEKKLNKLINPKEDKEYVIGLALRDQLIENYNYDFEKLSRKVKRLVRKYS